MLNQLKAAAVIAVAIAGKQVYDEAMLHTLRKQCDDAWTQPRDIRANKCNAYQAKADSMGVGL